MQPSDFISSLSESEAEWWASVIKEFRSDYIKEPKYYAKQILESKGFTKDQISERMDEVISSVREEVWQLYLIDEAKFHAAVLTYLFKNRAYPRSLLAKILEDKNFTASLTNLDTTQLTTRVSEIVGEYTGRVMPYIYELSLSTTQSRRSRAGKTFEHLVETLMDIFSYPYDTQSSVGTDFFTTHGLGKKVDLLVPGAQKYVQNRSKSAVVTVKTTLRERWQEVAEEISRTNVPHVYLLTVDEGVTSNIATTISRYNITLVVYGHIKEAQFRGFDNVQSFERFFNHEMPHIISYWG